MDRVRHLTLPLPKRIYEIADEHERDAEFIIRHQPDEAVRAIQDHLRVIFPILSEFVQNIQNILYIKLFPKHIY